MTKKLTIVSITYNHEKYIAEALDSFLMQKTDFQFEVIIADDCSTDNTAKIIQEYANKYPDIIKPILREKNIGCINNYIDTLSQAKGEYLIMCEGDDYFTDHLKLQKQVDFLDANQDYYLCFHKVRIFFDDGSRPDSIFPNKSYHFNKNVLELEDLLTHNFMQTNSVMYRWRFNHEKIEDVFPKYILPCDWFLHILHAQKGKIGFINETMSDYRRHKEGIWWESANDVEKIYLKHGIQMFNFSLAVENQIATDKKEYHKFVIHNAMHFLSIYAKHNKYDEIMQIVKLFPDIFEMGVKALRAAEKLKKYKKRNIFLIVLSSALALLFLLTLLRLCLAI